MSSSVMHPSIERMVVSFWCSMRTSCWQASGLLTQRMAGEPGVRWLVYLTLLFRSLDIEAKTSQKIWKTPVDGGWVTTGPGYNDSFLREAGIVNAVFF